VRTVNTFHSSRYVFNSGISSDAFPLVSALEMLLDIPSQPRAFSYLTDSIMARCVYSILNMDESRVTYEQVSRIITHDRSNFTQDSSSIEAINVYYALQTAENRLTEPLTTELISDIHAELTKNLDKPEPGVYRKMSAQSEDKAFISNYSPPASALDINFLMKHLTEWLTCAETAGLSPLMKGLLIHLHLKKIQPFVSVNGKTAKIAEIFMMRRHGLNALPFLLQEVYAQNRDEYYSSVAKFYETSDISAFAEFVSRRLILSIGQGTRTNLSYIRQNSVEKYLAGLLHDKELISRQHDFLMMLYKTGTSFSYEDMLLKKPFTNYYGKVSRTTAARDIKKFLDMGLIEESEKGYVFNAKFLSI